MTEIQSTLERELASALLEIGAVSFSPEKPYVWASGLRSPVYCDNRLTISHPGIRRLIRDGFVRIIEEQGLDPDVIAGTATAGIPHAAWLADRLNLPMVYVRSSAKGHGRGRRTEGRFGEGDDLVLVEDLVSTGMSSLDAVDALEEEGGRVRAVLAIFTYGLPAAASAFSERNVPLFTLTQFRTLVDVAERAGTIGPDAVDRIRAWHRDPAGWSAAAP